ncbi:cytochrome c biogenesis fc [Lasius niger]|uniref:Cytochrome c biogenesis fc n=1 Tax=Lasius niger TaxID=67767 RepID=A0A0J7KVT0_LASNI|nr:cytochrome c biogenesis fc [Lasius niger]
MPASNSPAAIHTKTEVNGADHRQREKVRRPLFDRGDRRLTRSPLTFPLASASTRPRPGGAGAAVTGPPALGRVLATPTSRERRRQGNPKPESRPRGKSAKLLNPTFPYMRET